MTDTLYHVETLTGLDLDRDGHTGRPQGHIVALSPYQGQQAQRAEQREGVAQVFRWFVMGCQHDTSLRRWESEMGREQYQEWRDLLIHSGYTRWKGSNERAGWELTADPETVIAGLHGAKL